MTEKQAQPSPKQTLVTLINSAVTAAKGGDQLLIGYANNLLSQFIDRAEITLPDPEKEEEA